MICYYDSSILLSAILEQRPKDELASCWDDVEIRLSSTLLKLECIVGIRRAGTVQNIEPDSKWVKSRLEILNEYLTEIYFRRVDDDIEEVVRNNSELSDCRTLDAVHVATALYLKPHLDEPITIVSLDNRLRRVAATFGFALLPEE